MSESELEFLRESNNIENEWDDKSLEDAIIAWLHCRGYQKLTKRVVLDVHSLLMQSRDTLEKTEKGVYRNGPVWVGGQEKPKWFALEELMTQWLEKMNSMEYSGPEKERDEWTKELHIMYEDIHPFFDGNGRTGRIFYNWHRLKLALPIDIIREKEKMKYYAWFESKRD